MLVAVNNNKLRSEKQSNAHFHYSVNSCLFVWRSVPASQYGSAMYGNRLMCGDSQILELSWWTTCQSVVAQRAIDSACLDGKTMHTGGWLAIAMYSTEHGHNGCAMNFNAGRIVYNKHATIRRRVNWISNNDCALLHLHSKNFSHFLLCSLFRNKSNQKCNLKKKHTLYIP